MIPKNGNLFTGLSEIEEKLLPPDEYPWQSLTRMLQFQTACRERRESWPAEFPCTHDLEEEVMSRHHGTVDSFGSLHVRGGACLKSDEDTKIIGPIILGKGVTLRKGAIVTGPCWIGDDVFIGHSCRITRSIILPGTKIVGQTRVSMSILGRNVEIGASVSLNDRHIVHPDEEIEYWDTDHCDRRGEQVPIKTGLVELGAIIGDGSRVGGGATLAPGAILFPRCIVNYAAQLLAKHPYPSGFNAGGL